MDATDEAQFYQKRFNFTGPVVITHELHEANNQATSGVNSTASVSAYLRTLFPGISEGAVNSALTLYPEASFTSQGLRSASMKQDLDLTCKNLAVTQALNNRTWNAVVAIGQASHGTDQSYYFYGQSASSGMGTMTGGPPGSSSGSSTSTMPSGGNTGNTTESGAGSAGGLSQGTSVNATIAIAMQKYLLSFVLTGDPNGRWTNETTYWPRYGSSATEMVFNTTAFTTQSDDLANQRCLFWNKALWY